jgi:hypothetical protein
LAYQEVVPLSSKVGLNTFNLETWEYVSRSPVPVTIRLLRDYSRTKVTELNGGCSVGSDGLDLAFIGKAGVSKIRFVTISDGTKISVTVPDDIRDGTSKFFTGLVVGKKIKPFERNSKIVIEHKAFKRAADVLKEYLLKAEFAKYVELLPEALEHAEECVYQHDGKLAKVLDKLPNFATKRVERKTPFHRLADLARETALGSVYRPAVAEAAIRQHGKHYRFLYNGKLTLFDEHITLGSGYPPECMSIHFIWDESLSKIVIGYFGKHLPLTDTK